MGADMRKLAAEFTGTFGWVFIGGGAIVINTNEAGALGLIGVAIANAFILSVMVTALMNISGAHLNPAVTLALWMAKKIDARGAVAYVVTQLVAAVAAALLIRFLLPATAGEVTSYGVPRIAPDITMWQAVVIEAVLTIFLVSAVFGTAVSPEAPPVGGFGIGTVLLFAILIGGPLTGAALNPARAFGPALVAMDWVGHLAYWIGPAIGGIVGSLLWTKVLLPKGEPQIS